MALDLADASKDDLKILLSNPALLVNIGLQGQGLWTEIQRISKELAAKEYVPLDLAKASQDDLKILLANPALLGLQGQDLVDEIERISKALVQKAAAAAPKQKVEITFDVHEHHFIGGDVNYLFYVLVDGNGTFHTNLTQPDLLAIQGETDYRNAGFHHGNIGLRKKTFDVSGEEGYLLVFSDRYSGIEEKTKQVASVLLASNKLKDLKFGEDAISWKPEIEEAGKYLAKIAKSTPLGDYSEAVNEATSLIVALYTYIEEHNFKAVARVLRFSPPPVPLPAGVSGPPPERAPLYTYPPGGKVNAQEVNLHIHSGHPIASFKIKSVAPDPAPVLPANPVRYHKAHRARRFYQQNLLNEPTWVTNMLP